MIPRKVRQHFDETLKSRVAGFRRENMTYMWIFKILKKKMNTPLSTVQIIAQMFEIKCKRKVSSGRPRAFTIKHDSQT